MKVKDLIKLLQTYNPDAEIISYENTGESNIFSIEIQECLGSRPNYLILQREYKDDEETYQHMKG